MHTLPYILDSASFAKCSNRALAALKLICKAVH